MLAVLFAGEPFPLSFSLRLPSLYERQQQNELASCNFYLQHIVSQSNSYLINKRYRGLCIPLSPSLPMFGVL